MSEEDTPIIYGLEFQVSAAKTIQTTIKQQKNTRDFKKLLLYFLQHQVLCYVK